MCLQVVFWMGILLNVFQYHGKFDQLIVLSNQVWDTLEYPIDTTAYFQWGILKNDPYNYTVNEENVLKC